MNDNARDKLIIETANDVKWIRRDFENHLTDHKKYMVMAWTTCIGLVITLAIIILKVL